MANLTKISSQDEKRRLPQPALGIDINFCRNPQCSFFMMPPDVLDGRGGNRGSAKSNYPRGKISGGGDDKSFICGVCGQASIVKNNRAKVYGIQTTSPEVSA